jgi:F-box/WD-40 domain protein MET30
MLQGILSQCCFPQLSYLSGAVRDLIRIDFITALPAEVSFKILSYLDTTSLCKAAQVSQRWRTLADDDVVWHKMCEQHIDRKCTKCGWGLPLLERKALRDWKRQQQLRATGRGLNQWSPDLTPIPDASQESSSDVLVTKKRHAERALSPDAKRACTPLTRTGSESYFTRPKFRPWKEVYKDRFKVGTNWKYGRYTTKIFKGHTNGVMCLQFDDSILATGSYDSTIKIWDVETGQEIRTLRGHTSGIRTLQFDDGKLVSGSLDCTIKIWDWKTGDCLSTQQGHTGGVITLNFEPNTNVIASGSIDTTIKVWNFEDKSTFCLRGHTDWVNAVKIDNASKTILSASDDCTARLWDMKSRTCIKVFEGHVGQVQQVLPLPADYEPEDSDDANDDDAASTTSSSSNNYLNEAEIRASFGPAFVDDPTRPLPARYVLTSALDSTIRLWDTWAPSPATSTASDHNHTFGTTQIPTVRYLKTFFGHVEGVWSIAGDTLRVVSGAQDRMVKIWDARTGKCQKSISGHAGPVTCVALSDSKLCSGGEDCEVRMYSFKSEDVPSENRVTEVEPDLELL